MKAERIGYASAFLASTCCVVPVGLAVLGLGSLGVGSWIGAYHWHLTAAAAVLLGIAWFYFLREKRRAEAIAANVPNEGTTKASLSLASAIVAAFVALNVYTAIGSGAGGGAMLPAAAGVGAAEAAEEVITIPVRGMSCVSCEYPIESNVKNIDGVLEADASAERSDLIVKMRRGAVSLEAIAEAVRAAGYEAELDRARRS